MLLDYIYKFYEDRRLKEQMQKEAELSIFNRRNKFYYAHPTNIIESIVNSDNGFDYEIARLLEQEDYAEIGKLIESQSYEYWRIRALDEMKAKSQSGDIGSPVKTA